jgi:RIO-like serine/threonine protein kinase
MSGTEVAKAVIKNITYTEDNNISDIENEVVLQTIASELGLAPRIFTVKYEDDHAVLAVEEVEEMSVADMYGENSEDLPESLWDKIRNAVKILLDEEGIEYVALSPYNFVEREDGSIYITNFGDAYIGNGDEEIDQNLQDFLDGSNEWSADFA